jgi:hypothetical protein
MIIIHISIILFRWHLHPSSYIPFLPYFGWVPKQVAHGIMTLHLLWKRFKLQTKNFPPLDLELLIYLDAFLIEHAHPSYAYIISKCHSYWVKFELKCYAQILHQCEIYNIFLSMYIQNGPLSFVTLVYPLLAFFYL